jgi:CheY-like chemotaxis protein
MRHIISIVLIDLSMPVLDGIGATVQIRKFEAKQTKLDISDSLRPVRILALTGMSGLEDKRRAFEAGVDG